MTTHSFLSPAQRSAIMIVSALLLCLSTPLFAQENGSDFSRLLLEVSVIPDTDIQEGDQDAGNRDSVPSSTAAPATLLSDISEYENSIAVLEAEAGPYVPAITEQLQALGGLYEQVGNHGKAIETYEKAMHVIRVNNGLFTLAQLDMVEDVIRNYGALGNYEEVGNHKEYLFYLKQKNYSPGDSEMLQAKRDWADWNVEAYLKEVEELQSSPVIITSTGPFPSQVIPVYSSNGSVRYISRNDLFGPSFSSSFQNGGLGTPGMGQALHPSLRTARDLYEEISETLTEKEDIRNPVLLDSQQKLANIAYMTKQEADVLESRLVRNNFYSSQGLLHDNSLITRAYADGREALETVLENLQEAPETDPVAIAGALLNLGDWHLSFDKTRRAFNTYKEAHSMLASKGLSEAEITEIISPRLPQEIPTFILHPFSRRTLGIPEDVEVQYQGYIDLQMSVSKYGNTRQIVVIESSDDTPYQVRNSLLEHIRYTRIRPRLEEGEAAAQEDLKLRYYYSY